MRITQLLLLLLLFVASCSKKEKVPASIMQPPKMQEVMWDMISAGEFLNGYLLNKDSVDKLAESSKIYGQVLQIHKIKKEDFDKSFRYYREHPALMKALLDSLGKKTYAPAKLPGQADTVHKGGGSIISQKDTMRKRIRKALKAD